MCERGALELYERKLQEVGIFRTHGSIACLRIEYRYRLRTNGSGLKKHCRVHGYNDSACRRRQHELRHSDTAKPVDDEPAAKASEFLLPRLPVLGEVFFGTWMRPRDEVAVDFHRVEHIDYLSERVRSLESLSNEQHYGSFPRKPQ